jgi:hypothetical protein
MQSLSTLYRELGLNAAPADDDDKRALRATVIQTPDLGGNDANLATEARLFWNSHSRAGAHGRDGRQGRDQRGGASRRQGVVGGTAERVAEGELARRTVSLSLRARLVRGSRSSSAVGNFALTPDLRSQDAATFIGAFLANPIARPLAWAFVKQHWNQLGPKTTISLGDVRLVESLGAFCDAQSRDDIKDFFKAHKLPAASRALDQTIEKSATASR